MKQVQKTIGLWVQRITGKNRGAAATHARQLPELDAKSLRQVSGGSAETTQLPTKGW
jgi:hypothetical protein